MIVAGGIGLLAIIPGTGKEGASNAMQGNLVIILLVGWALTIASPWTVGALTRGWTALVPLRSGPWLMARKTVVTRGDRLASSVVPVMSAVGLLFGLAAIGHTTNAAIAAAGYDFQLDGVSADAMPVLVAPPLAVAIAALEGVIITVTAVLQGQVMSAVGLAVLMTGITRAGWPAPMGTWPGSCWSPGR